ncbi:MAG: hypothetical protein M1839_002994 [Geoglossum umbratile]|nr:MAG: hypothetical protein M1839_002994 [Geoglossum umbratile]
MDVLEGREEVFGEAHPATLTAMASLAATYYGQGCWSKARALEVGVLERLKSMLGEDHHITQGVIDYLREQRQIEVQVLETEFQNAKIDG